MKGRPTPSYCPTGPLLLHLWGPPEADSVTGLEEQRCLGCDQRRAVPAQVRIDGPRTP